MVPGRAWIARPKASATRSGFTPTRRSGEIQRMNASSMALTGVVAVTTTAASDRVTRSTKVSIALSRPYHHHCIAPTNAAMRSTPRAARASVPRRTRATRATTRAIARNTQEAGMLRTSTMERLSTTRPASFTPTGSRCSRDVPGW